MDTNARDDCDTIVDLLRAAGLSPVASDDSAPGVPEGAYEVQVPADQATEADRIVADHPLPDEVETVDDSSDLDLSEPIYHSEGSTTAEFEANAIKSVLESNGIAAIIVGDTVLPNMPFEVRVAAEYAPRALQVLEDAQRGGAEAADEAQAAQEEESRAREKRAAERKQ